MSTTDLLLEGAEDREDEEEEEDLEEEEEVLEVRVIGEEVVLVVVVVVVVTVVLSFLRLRDFLLVVEGEVVMVVVAVVVVGFGVVDVVVVGMDVVGVVDSQGFEVLMRFHQGLREVAGSGVAVVVVLVSVTEDLSVVEVKLFHHFRLGDRGNEKNVLV